MFARRDTRTLTDTHRHEQKTRNTQEPNRIKTTIFRDKKFDVFFDAPENVTCTKSLFPNVRRRSTRAGARGRTMWPENAVGASDRVVHSRIFIVRVEPSSARNDILHIPQYQLNLRHLSSTAAVRTQSLHLPGFLPHPGFPRSAGVTWHTKSDLSAHQNLVLGQPRLKI